jgi:phosphinothricin acetyltransferase
MRPEEARAPAGSQAVVVRYAAPRDLPRLTEIYNHYIATSPATFDIEPFALDERRLWFDKFAESGPHRLFVADNEGVVLGFACTSQFRTKPAYDTSVETTIYCAPEATGRGVGRLLYSTLFDALRGEDLRMAVAGITLPNAASVALHERFGFTLAGVMHDVGRKFGRYWDVAWYEKSLGG